MRRSILPLFLLACLALFIVAVEPDKAQAVAAWAPNTAYHIGDEVTYQDSSHPNHLYKCQQAHTSLVGWEPPNAPALWTDEGPYNGSSATNTPVPTATNGPSATPTKTSTPAPTSSSGPLPKHLITGYWQDFVNGATALH